jgi:hypothetical protein
LLFVWCRLEPLESFWARAGGGMAPSALNKGAPESRLAFSSSSSQQPFFADPLQSGF